MCLAVGCYNKRKKYLMQQDMFSVTVSSLDSGYVAFMTIGVSVCVCVCVCVCVSERVCVCVCVRSHASFR